MQSPDEPQRRFFDELRELRLSSRERGYEQALESELLVLNPRHVLHEKSPMLAWAETEEALALDAEFGERAGLAGHELLSGEATPAASDVQLVRHYVVRMHARGTELRLDLGHVFRSQPTHRAPIDTRQWRWRHVIGVKIAKELHINVLELRASGLSMRWRLRRRSRRNRLACVRVLHLTDSQVCLSVLSKRRTASRRLLAPLRKISARLTGGGLVLTGGYATSERHPADEPSRAP